MVSVVEIKVPEDGSSCIKKFNVSGKSITLYPSANPDCPLIILNSHSGDGSGVVEKLSKMTDSAGFCPSEINFLVVSGLDWNRDMTPWPCPPLYKDGESFAGGADEYLELLISEIIPCAKAYISGEPSKTCIAGYSLAGLFALYAMYRRDAFDRAASMSGSLWFPGFKEFAESHDMKKKPGRIYLSLGDKEARTRQPLMQKVEENTKTLAEYYRRQGIDVKFEMNPGNHFRDVDVRCAKGIAAISD